MGQTLASARADHAQAAAVGDGDGATDNRQMGSVRKATMTSKECEAQNLPLEWNRRAAMAAHVGSPSEDRASFWRRAQRRRDDGGGDGAAAAGDVK